MAGVWKHFKDGGWGMYVILFWSIMTVGVIVERALYLLRCTDRSITDICFDVGFASLGTFSKTFHLIVGESPTAYRQRGVVIAVPTCFAMAWTRPSSFGEDERAATG